MVSTCLRNHYTRLPGFSSDILRVQKSNREPAQGRNGVAHREALDPGANFFDEVWSPSAVHYETLARLVSERGPIMPIVSE